MERLFCFSGDTINGIAHGSGTLYTELYTFTGTWEKGLRINSGTFDFFDFTMKVKFKQGKLYKLIETTAVPISGMAYEVPQTNYRKHGEFFNEIPSTENLFLICIDGFYLFDGLFAPSYQISIKKINNFHIYSIQDKYFNIKEIRSKNFRLISKFIGSVPHGRGKLFLENNIYIKGFLMKNYFIGPCKIVQGSLRIKFDGSFSHFPEKFRIKSDELEFQTEGNSKDNRYYFTLNQQCLLFKSLLESFIQDAFDQYLMFTKAMNISPFYKWIIFYCILPKKNWIDLENKISKAYFYSKEMKNKSNKSYNVNEKDFQVVSKIEYEDKSLYFGQMSHGMKNGLGCLVFSDTSRFKGYFKNDRISGIGNFYALSYKIKGIWKENRLDKIINYYELN